MTNLDGTRNIIPDDATPFVAQNATDITTTTAVAIIAAPAAGKAHYITGVHFVNSHATETPIIILEDTDATELTRFALGDLADLAAKGGSDIMHFPVPLQVVTAKGVSGKASAATTGDTRVTLYGYTGTVKT